MSVDREPHHELHAVLETAHEAFVSIDEDGCVVAWNPEAERTFGWARSSALGRPLRDLVIPSRYRGRHEEGLRRFLATGEGPLLNKRLEITALHRSGHEFPVELTISALERNGRWTFNAFIRDISERYRAQEAQARLATLVEHSADAIISRTTEGVVTSWNPAAERLYGYLAEEMIGRTVDRLVPAERDGEARTLTQRVAAGDAVLDFETQRVRKDGSLVDVSLTVSPIRDDAGRVSEIAMIVRDIGTRKLAERALAAANEELRQLNELKSAFVAIASHELRTPLTSISGFAATLLTRWEALAEEDKRRFVAAIQQESRRLHELVEDLLTVSRIEAGVFGGAVQAVEVKEMVEDVIQSLALEHIHVSARGPCFAAADPDGVRRIAINLLENARRYGAPPIEVVIEGSGEDVVVSVVDHGAGVAAEFVPHLYDRFTQDRQRAGEPRGTGLGLAIVRALAEAVAGEAWYEPNEPAGSRFCVRLPRAARP